MHPPEISIVIPVHNEEGNIEPLVREIVSACRGVIRFELIFVDDHSSDATLAIVRRLQTTTIELRVLQQDRQSGQSRSIYHGVQAARAAWIITLDGDGQNDPADIALLLAARSQADTAVKLFCGWRVQRQDRQSRRWASRWANTIRSRLLGDRTPDTGCGLKLFERIAFLQLPYFDHMHRYLPALIQRDGWQTQSIPVNHRERGTGASKYTNWQRALVGVRDLFGVAWLLARRRPCKVKEIE